MAKRSPVYGLMAKFDHPLDLLHAAEAAKKEGYEEIDAYSPFPIEGLAETLGFHTKLPLLVLIAGILGAAGGYFMQYWMSAVDYPINIGGRPLHSWPAFIPVTFETMVLLAGITAVVGMLALNGLPRPYHPVFNVKEFEAASDDKFFLMIELDDPKFDMERTRAFLESLNPKGIYVVDC